MTQTYTDALPNARNIVELAVGTSTEHSTDLTISGAYTLSSAYIGVSAGNITLNITVPNAPTDLAATFNTPNVDLTWTAPLDDGGSALQGYLVYRGTISGSLSLLDAAASTSYSDTSPPTGTVYYAITAVNAIGQSDQSDEASVSVGSTIVTSFNNGNT